MPWIQAIKRAGTRGRAGTTKDPAHQEKEPDPDPYAMKVPNLAPEMVPQTDP